MARSLYSNDYVQCEDPICKELKSDLALLKDYLGLRKLLLLKWDEDRIAIPLTLKVSLPPRGNHKDIDIRLKENVLFVFHRTSYPDIPPRVYSDRKTFPKDGLSHLYVTKKGKPVPFCLVRGNYAEWYADILITDLVIQVQNWLSDAANGNLVIDGKQFDPMRLEGYQGEIIYDHNHLSNLIQTKTTFDDYTNILFLLLRENQQSKIVKDKLIYPSFEIVKIITEIKELMDSFKPVVKSISEKEISPDSKRLLFGAVIWNEELKINNRFPEQMPVDLNSLIKFCDQADINIRKLTDFLPLIKLAGIDEMPLLVALNRPLPLIGYDSTIEIFNFFLRFGENTIKEKKIVENMRVGYQKHSQPLSIRKAKEVAGNTNFLGKVVVIGCGAVGSKVVTHLIREGSLSDQLILFDDDKVEPHNMVRYGLLSDAVGSYKAVALRNAAAKMYPLDNENLKIIGLPFKGDTLFGSLDTQKLINGFSWFLDFTASHSFENLFIKQELAPEIRIARGSIRHKGRIGTLLIEGDNRNPRIDDLKILIQARYIHDIGISTWLVEEFEESTSDNVLVNVGVGCNSETTILNDIDISIHSAAFLKAIKNENVISESQGIAHLTIIQDDPTFDIRTKRLVFKPLTILADERSGWQIRIKNGLADLMMSEMGRFSPSETGGTLIGVVNNKTKCIYVTSILMAPPDSEANEVCFIRGIEGLPEEVDKHKRLSGQTFGYIGEWHSHPMGPLCPSSTDLRAMKKTKLAYKRDGLRMPVLILIATPVGLIACLE